MTNELLYSFAPDPRRANFLYDQIKRRLVDSFRQIAAASQSVVEVDDGRLARCLDAVTRANHVSPALFGLYFDLLRAVDRDDLDEVSALFTQLLRGDHAGGIAAYRGLTDEDLGAGNAERYRRWFDNDVEEPLDPIPIDREQFDRVSRLADEALAILDAGAPEVSGEMRGYIAQIIFAKGKPGVQSTFHGVTSFFVWGALMFNADSNRTSLDLVGALTHECSHSHLYAVAIDGPLVFNPDEELHPSPLRTDPRPMDGIYHAAYVTAREHYAMNRLLQSGVLDAEQRKQAEHELRYHVRNFRAGMATVEAHGQLSDLGATLLATARDYMASI